MTLWDYLMIFAFIVGLVMLIAGIFTYYSNKDNVSKKGAIQWYTYLLLIGGIVLMLIALIYACFRLFG